MGNWLCTHRKRKEKVKKNKWMTGSVMIIGAALVFAGLTPVQAQRARDAKPQITVLNPAIESRMVDRLPLSPRLDTLEGKTLYLVDIGWGGPEAAYSVFEEIQAWFAQKMPGVKTVLKRKRGPYSQDDPQLWKEIAQNGHAALIGISG
jgi:antitoxin (DNA-binding transcriptional repressor) of toxin-antitoxin stability system